MSTTSNLNLYPPYLEPNSDKQDIHGETSGYLPPGRIDVSSNWDQTPPAKASANIIAYNPETDTAPTWYALADLVVAAEGVPTGSLLGTLASVSWDGTVEPGWEQLVDADGVVLGLTIEGGAGGAVVEGSLPVSIVNGSASRAIDIRLVADGYVVGSTTLTPSTSSASGTSLTASFGPTTLIFPPLATHSIHFDVKPANGGAVTIWSDGMEIDVAAAPIIPATVGGDLSGDTDNATVIAIQGTPVSADAPGLGEVLTFNGTEWVSDTVNSLNGNEVAAAMPSAGDALVWDGSSWVNEPLAGDVTGSVTANTVERIQGRSVSSAAPSVGQVLVWDGSMWIPDSPAGVGVKASDLLTRFAPLTDHTGDLIVKTNGAVILVEEPNP